MTESDPKDELGARFEDHTPDSDDKDNSNNSNNASNTSDASGTASKPGPEKSANSTRNRKQVPMYLTDEKADLINGLYERLDGRSKVAGDGGIEKHADFMEEVVELAVAHEDDLAERLGIEHDR